MSRFDALSSLEFEELVADLLSEQLGVTYRIGPAGRDGGIDGLAHDDAGVHVLQCKHYRNSSYRQLLREVEREAAAFRQRSPVPLASYRLATSQRLTHANRTELVTALDGLVSSPENILGESDLAGLLRSLPQVEAQHPKLWLASGAQLHRRLSGESYARAGALLADIDETLPLWVPTEAFAEGRAVLEREAVCVIAGPAGIGKTTLARLLVHDSIQAGYQPFEIVQGELAAAWRLLDAQESTPGADAKLVFLFDDFLGQTALLDRRGGDPDLSSFLRAVARRGHTRLVLATREYILQHAERVSEVLGRSPVLNRRLALTLDSYTRDQRARIFYNHLWHSEEVDDAAIDSLRAERSYLAVVDHPAYSPRVIEWMTGHAGRQLSAEDRGDYARFCLYALDHPDELWDRAFSEGLDDAQRALLLSLIGLPSRVDEPALRTAFEGACDARGIDTAGHRFERALRVLDNSFISSDRDREGATFSALNPSLLDFLQRYVAASLPDARRVVRGAVFFEQVILLFDVLREDNALMLALLADFAAAFERTFASPTRRLAPRSISQIAAERDVLSSVGGRAEAVQRRAAAWPAMLPLVDRLIRDGAERYVTEMDVVDLLDVDAFPRLRRFISAGLLEARRAAEGVLDRLDADGLGTLFELSFYDAIDSARALDPSAVTVERWAGYRREAAVWIAEVLEDPLEVIDDEDELRHFRDVITAFDVEVEEYVLDGISDRLSEIEDEAMEHRLEEASERARWERDSYGYDRDTSGSDASLDRLFGGLG